MRTKLNLVLTCMAVAVFVEQTAHAQDMIPGGEERIKVYAGGILARVNSRVSLDGTTGQGSEIDLASPGASKNASNFLLGAEWRVGNRHRLGGLFFTTSKQRSLSFDQTITIENDTLVPPTVLESDARNRFLLANYQYSFVKNEDIELAGVIGAYINKFNVDLTGTAQVQNNVDGNITTTTRDVGYNPGVTVPMPLIGGSIDWFVSPRFKVAGSLSGLKAKIGDVDGSVFVASVSAEYMFTRNIGAGVSFMHAQIDVDITKRDFVGSIDWKNDNLLAYALLKF